MENLYFWSALANIILVGVLVGITWWYAHTLYKQSKKPIIIEMCKILDYFRLQLNSSIKHLKNKKYGWNGRTSEYIKKLQFLLPNSLDSVIFKGDFLKIMEKIDKHNNEVERIEESLKRLDKLILTSGFKEKCKTLIDEFNEKSKTKTSHHGLHEFVYEDIPYLTRPIIDNDDKVRPTDRTYGNFWNEYGLELLKVREKDSIKKEIESLYLYTDRLIEFSSDLKNDIERQLLKYKDKYGITDEMMEGKSQILTTMN
jgi:hypothetical protein